MGILRENFGIPLSFETWGNHESQEMITAAMTLCSTAWLPNKTPECLQRLILTPGAFCVLASIDEAVVGFGSAGETGEVTLCYVAPSLRFIGTASA